MADKLRVLFVCAKNDVRSLMAEALLRHSDCEHFEALSAGLVASEVDPPARWSLSITSASTPRGYAVKPSMSLRGNRSIM